VAVIAPADSAIKTPADLKGKRIGVPALEGASFVGLRALLAAAGLKPDDVTLEVVGFNQVEALSAKRVDAAVVYSNNEPIRLAAQGQALNVIQVSDYAALAANGILTNEATLANNPDLVRRFVRALVRGTQQALADPEAAYAVSKKYVEALTDDAVEKQVLAATLDLWRADRIGLADAQAWENMQSTLLEAGMLSTPLDLSKAFTNDYVP
jgi:NitT/TauT family transport system substrate-binding protein